KRATKQLQQRQAQAVHADVVVLPERARRPHRARHALVGLAEVGLAEVTVVVDRIGLAEQRARPLAGLLQEVAPRDRAVLLGVEVDTTRRLAHALVEAFDEAARDADARKRR